MKLCVLSLLAGSLPSSSFLSRLPLLAQSGRVGSVDPEWKGGVGAIARF